MLELGGGLLAVTDHIIPRERLRWVRGPVSSFMSSWHRAMDR